MKRPELLAPAGNEESLRAAVAGGADAVYLGAKRFGARAYSDNFDESGLRAALDFAHAYGVKIYVTLNTLIFPAELEEALRLAEWLSANGADGLLVQDLGLTEILRKKLPGLPLHASTQMHIHNLAGVRLLENLGFARAVLARETPKEEVEEIAREPIETEIFVYGALCVSYSGQCYLSYANGGRSGNRGECAQPCRLAYRLYEDGAEVRTPGEYLLSPRDLYTLDRVPELLKLNASCWKIEGRMKRPEYVYFVTSQYRRAIDAALKGEPFAPDLEGAMKLFNRGFTPGHLFLARGPELMEPKRPNHQGIPLGQVSSAASGRFALRLSHDLHQGDGIRILGKSDQGLVANKIYHSGKLASSAKAGETVSFDYEPPVLPGSAAVLTSDRAQLDDLAQHYRHLDRHEPIALKVTAKVGVPLRFSANYRSIFLVMADDQKLERANSHALAKAEWLAQLAKTQDTPYRFDPISFDLDPDVFVPVSRINRLRRRLLERIRQRLTARPDPVIAEYSYFRFPVRHTADILVTVSTKEQYAAVKALPVTVFAAAGALAEQLGIAAYELPRVNEDQSFADLTAAFVNEPGELAVKAGDKYASQYLNAANAPAVRFLDAQGCRAVEVSRELTLPMTAELVRDYRKRYGEDPNLIAFVYGRRDLMVTKYCAPNTYRDPGHQKGCGLCRRHSYELRNTEQAYPLSFDESCFMHIREAAPYNAMDQLRELRDAGITNFHLSFTDEDPDTAAGLVRRILGSR